MNNLLVLPFLVISISGFIGLSFLGELKSDAFPYLYILIFIPVLLIKRNFRLDIPKEYLLFCLVFFSVITIGFIFNSSEIVNGSFRDRTSLNKFFTSLFVVLYSFSIPIFLFNYLNITSFNETVLKERIFKPILLGFYVLIPLFFLEVFSWFFENPIYNSLSSIFFSGTFSTVEFRLRGLSAEPSFFANFITFCFIIAMFMKRDFKYPKLIISIILILLFLTGARTAYLVVICIAPLYYLNFEKVPLLIKNYARSLFALIILFMFFLLINADVLGWHFSDQENISNLSRFSSVSTALEIAKQNPMFGVGLGQYAFHAIEHLPLWSFDSYEIISWFDNNESTWPPTYSLYARLLSEVGLVGFIVFFCYLIHLYQKIFKIKGISAETRTMLCSLMIYCLVSPLPFDSFRNPFFWVALTVVFCFTRKKGCSNDFK